MAQVRDHLPNSTRSVGIERSKSNRRVPRPTPQRPSSVHDCPIAIAGQDDDRPIRRFTAGLTRIPGREERAKARGLGRQRQPPNKLRLLGSPCRPRSAISVPLRSMVGSNARGPGPSTFYRVVAAREPKQDQSRAVLNVPSVQELTFAVEHDFADVASASTLCVCHANEGGDHGIARRDRGDLVPFHQGPTRTLLDLAGSRG